VSSPKELKLGQRSLCFLNPRFRQAGKQYLLLRHLVQVLLAGFGHISQRPADDVIVGFVAREMSLSFKRRVTFVKQNVFGACAPCFVM
jgi:hypothetical protein